jgi:excisionase family DNA binding protein
VTEVTLSEAASRLGVSVDTVRRRLRSGELAGRQLGRRTLVTVPESVSPSRRAGDELLAEVRAERDRLAAQVDALNRQLEAAAAERAELRGLLARALDLNHPRG